jgi:hypothetical protein
MAGRRPLRARAAAAASDARERRHAPRQPPLTCGHCRPCRPVRGRVPQGARPTADAAARVRKTLQNALRAASQRFSCPTGPSAHPAAGRGVPCLVRVGADEEVGPRARNEVQRVVSGLHVLPEVQVGVVEDVTVRVEPRVVLGRQNLRACERMGSHTTRLAWSPPPTMCRGRMVRCE